MTCKSFLTCVLLFDVPSTDSERTVNIFIRFNLSYAQGEGQLTCLFVILGPLVALILPLFDCKRPLTNIIFKRFDSHSVGSNR